MGVALTLLGSTAETTGAEREDEPLVAGYSGRMLLFLSLGWLTMQMGRQLLPPLLPTIIADFSITPARAGFALTLLWGLYALAQYPGGRMSDRLSRKTMLVAGAALSIVGFAIFAGSRTYAMLLVGAVVVGGGAGLYPTASLALLSDLFDRRRGQAFGIHNACGDLGGALAAGVVIVALSVAAWQAAFLPVIALLGVVAVGLHKWNRERYVLDRPSFELRATLARLGGDPSTRWLLVAYSLYAFTWQGSTGFLPTLLQVEKGFSPAFATSGFAALFVVGAIVNPIAGLLGDRIERRAVAAGVLTVGVLGIVTIIALETRAAVVLGVVVFAVGLMAFPPVMQAYVMDVLPDTERGGDFGAVRAVYISAGSLGPTYVGLVAEFASYTAAFVGLAACLLGSVGLIAWLRRHG